jgi:hypothetical protein
VAGLSRRPTEWLSSSSTTPLLRIQSGGVCPAFAYSITPVAVSRRPRKSVTNFDWGRFSLSATLSCATNSAGRGLDLQKMRNDAWRPAIINPAVTPLPLTSAMAK